MIKVVVGNNVQRKSTIVDSSTTLRQVLDAAQIDYTRGAMHLDGARSSREIWIRPLPSSVSLSSAIC